MVCKSERAGQKRPCNFGEPILSAYGPEASNAYSQKEYENSPLNRVLKQAAPGNSWKLGSGHEIKFDYQTNTASEVLKFGVSNPTTTPTLTLSGKYAANQLYKTVTTDENGQPIQEFKDKEGKVLLKRIHIVSTGSNNSNGNHDTYYVYDVYGNLTFVLPPLLIKNANNSSTASSYINRLNELGYQYKYDDKNRLVEKKLPGKGWEYMVYDNQDRLVGTQDANQRTEGVWLFTKYDKFGRIAVTGKAWDPGTRTDVQNYINQLGSNNVSRGSGYQQDNIQIYYNTDGFGANNHVLSVHYYDDYPSYPLGVNTTADVQGHALAKGTKLKGLPTLTVTRSLDTWENNTWNFEYAYTLYDAQYLYVVKSHKVNYLGGHTIVENQLDFRGKPLQTITKHKRKSTDTEITVKKTFSYDHFERLKNQTHQVNNGKVEVIAQNTYNAIGQLSQKKVGNSTSTPYQTVDYTYNIRGWLTDINNITENQTGTYKDLFAFKIGYDKKDLYTDESYGKKFLYNGNISETRWKSANNPTVRSYDYAYDGLNRLLDAAYTKGNYQVVNAYNESLQYDHNGNIKSVLRSGNQDLNNNTVYIDDLEYTYQANSNKLLKVKDQVSHASGFKDGTNTGNDYAYDENGNLTKDFNKGISKITYNHLNLPTEVIWNATKKINYAYDASGVKLRKIVTDGTKVTTTDYLGGFQYKNNDLQFFPTSEGYVNVVTNKVSGGRTYNYVYNYTDHLGNVRVSYAWDDTESKLKVIEENHYYPFGLKHTGYNDLTLGVEIVNSSDVRVGIGVINMQTSGSDSYKYKFGAKELQEEFNINLYDYGARNYDPAIGRWMNVDPLAEVMPALSPYSFVFNNPLSFIDPDGRIPYPITIRSFAPFNYFGGGFHGDGANRGYTTSSTATARVHQRINFDTDKSKISAKAWSSETYHRFAPFIKRTETPSVEFIDGFRTRTNGDSKTFMFGTHSKGANPLVPGSPNIDVFSDFSITENKKAGTLDISGKLTGDNFPSTEAFITDPSGQNVFLGIGYYEGSPFSSLDGENKRDILSFNFSISTDKKGNFTGVKMGDKSYSVSDWNKMFEKADPHKNKD